MAAQRKEVKLLSVMHKLCMVCSGIKENKRSMFCDSCFEKTLKAKAQEG